MGGKGNVNEKTMDPGKRICNSSVLFRRVLDQVIAQESAGYTDSVSCRNFWVLDYLKRHEGENVCQKDLETVFQIRRSTVSRTVELMEQKQLITRESVSGDARLKKLCLTEKSEAVLEAISKGIAAVEKTVRDAFTEKEFETLMGLLSKMDDVLQSPSLLKNEEKGGERQC
jgi:DNA-binding MarR family transcriptional regulator